MCIRAWKYSAIEVEVWLELGWCVNPKKLNLQRVFTIQCWIASTKCLVWVGVFKGKKEEGGCGEGGGEYIIEAEFSIQLGKLSNFG